MAAAAAAAAATAAANSSEAREATAGALANTTAGGASGPFNCCDGSLAADAQRCDADGRRPGDEAAHKANGDTGEAKGAPSAAPSSAGGRGNDGPIRHASPSAQSAGSQDASSAGPEAEDFLKQAINDAVFTAACSYDETAEMDACSLADVFAPATSPAPQPNGDAADKSWEAIAHSIKRRRVAR